MYVNCRTCWHEFFSTYTTPIPFPFKYNNFDVEIRLLRLLTFAYHFCNENIDNFYSPEMKEREKMYEIK